MKVSLRPKSIVNQLTLWYSIATFLVLAFSSFFLYWNLAETLKVENDHILYEHVQTIHSILNRKEAPLESLRRRIESEWILKDFQKIYVKIQDSSGRILIQSPLLTNDLDRAIFSNLTFQSEKELLRGANRVENNADYYLIFAKDLGKILPDYPPIHLYIALNSSQEEHILENYRSQLGMILTFVFLFSVIFGRQIAIRGLLPVTQMIEAVKKVKSTTLDSRIQPQNWSTEIRTLASSFNHMLERLEDAFRRLSVFSSDIAHEIRTPVSSIVGTIEVTLCKPRSIQEYQDVLESCLEEGQRISKIIESLLFVAKSENPETQINKEIVELNKEIRQILDFYEIVASEKKIRLDFVESSVAFIPVERTLFQRAVGNILSNAIEYTLPDGVITLQIVQEPKFYSIIFQDTGEGISKEHLLRVSDRFYRADPSRKPRKNAGYGLGLTITQGIMRLHQGELKIESHLHLGTKVTLDFPKLTKM